MQCVIHTYLRINMTIYKAIANIYISIWAQQNPCLLSLSTFLHKYAIYMQVTVLIASYYRKNLINSVLNCKVMNYKKEFSLLYFSIEIEHLTH